MANMCQDAIIELSRYQFPIELKESVEGGEKMALRLNEPQKEWRKDIYSVFGQDTSDEIDVLVEFCNRVSTDVTLKADVFKAEGNKKAMGLYNALINESNEQAFSIIWKNRFSENARREYTEDVTFWGQSSEMLSESETNLNSKIEQLKDKSLHEKIQGFRNELVEFALLEKEFKNFSQLTKEETYAREEIENCRDEITNRNQEMIKIAVEIRVRVEASFVNSKEILEEFPHILLPKYKDNDYSVQFGENVLKKAKQLHSSKNDDGEEEGGITQTIDKIKYDLTRLDAYSSDNFKTRARIKEINENIANIHSDHKSLEERAELHTKYTDLNYATNEIFGKQTMKELLKSKEEKRIGNSALAVFNETPILIEHVAKEAEIEVEIEQE